MLLLLILFILVAVVFYLLGQNSVAPSIICPACGKTNPGNAKVCQYCGKELAPDRPKICPQCRQTYGAAVNFCPACGVPLVAKAGEGRGADEELIVTCPSCGARNMTRRTKCWQCGELLHPDAANHAGDASD